MKGVDNLLLIGGAVLMAGIAIAISFNLLSPVSGTVNKAERLGTLEILTAPGGAIKIATYTGEDSQAVREATVNLINLSASTPYAKAVHPATTTLEMSDYLKTSKILKEEGISTSFSLGLFSNCQQWITFTDPLMTTFNAGDSKLIGRYYAGLSSVAGRPDSLSELLNENWGEAQKMCGISCVNAEICASCDEMAKNFRAALEHERFTEAQEIESSMRLKGCADSCAQICESVYSPLKALYGTDIEAKNAYISGGVMIK